MLYGTSTQPRLYLDLEVGFGPGSIYGWIQGFTFTSFAFCAARFIGPTASISDLANLLGICDVVSLQCSPLL